MKIIPEKDADPDEIIKVLELGKLVIFPCETVYGVGCDCESRQGVLCINRYKQRPFGKPYAIMASSREMAERYVEINDTAGGLYTKFLPGPLTVISKVKKSGHRLAKGVASEKGTLGVRIPDYPFVRQMISSFGRPIVATSANASYRKRPYNLDDIWDNISDKQKQLVDIAVDAGELPHNEPSTVVDTTLDDQILLRQGDLKLSDKNIVTSRSEENTRNTGKELWQKYEQYAGSRAIVFALEGEMGAGKTQLTKGIGKAMGVKEEIISPTFNLELEYTTEYKESATKLIHFDAWRMESDEEITQLGLTDLINEKSVIVIEWADRVAETIRKFSEDAVIVWVKINYSTAVNEREISWGVLC